MKWPCLVIISAVIAAGLLAFSPCAACAGDTGGPAQPYRSPGSRPTGTSAYLAPEGTAWAAAPDRVAESSHDQAEQTYLPPDDPRFLGDARAYVEQAERFLAEHSNSSQAPRVLMDLVMVGVVKQNVELSDQAKRRLLLEHSYTLQAAFVLALFKDADDYRKFLDGLVKADEACFAAAFGQQYCGAFRLGVWKWGPDVLGEEDSLLKTALMANVAADVEVQSACRAKLAQAKPGARRIAEIAFDPRRVPADKVLALHAIEDHKSAPLYERFFYSRLLPHERQKPAILHVQAENLLERGEFAEALPVIEALLEDRSTPQRVFWKAWCLASLGRTDESLELLAGLQRFNPRDPWAADAAELARCVETCQANLDRYASALLALGDRVKKEGVGIAEGTVCFRHKEGRVLNVYVGWRGEGGHLEVIAQRDKDTLLAYMTSDKQSRMYFVGERMIYGFAQQGFYPDPDFEIIPNQNGTFNYAWDVQFADSPEKMAAAKGSLSNFPLLTTREGILLLLAPLTTGAGRFPRPVETTAAGSLYCLLKPEVRRPGFSRIEFRVSRDGKLVSVEVGPLSLENLRYGPQGSFALAPPAWPDLPVVEKEKMDPGMFFRLLGAAATLLSPKEETVAETGTPTRR